MLPPPRTPPKARPGHWLMVAGLLVVMLVPLPLGVLLDWLARGTRHSHLTVTAPAGLFIGLGMIAGGAWMVYGKKR